MPAYNFTRAEAEALLGKRFETLVEWDGVARGTFGEVRWTSGRTVWAPETPYEDYEVVIAWDPDDQVQELPRRSRFSKFEMQKYLRAAAH